MSVARRIAAAAAIGLAVAAPVGAAEPALAIPGGSLRIAQRGAATVLAITWHGRTTRTAVPVDDGIVAGSLGTTQLVGTLPGQVLILASDYASRPNGGPHQCGAGTETELRVIALRHTPRQTFHQRVESCWQTIDKGEVRWNRGARTLTVERTTYDPDTRHLRTRYQITPEGVVTQIQTDQLP